MTATCPAGHTSATDDYCDQCGARISGAAAPPVTAGSAAASPSPATAAADRPCPTCGAPNGPADTFCELCGTNLATGAAPAPPPTAVADPGVPIAAPTAGLTEPPAEEEAAAWRLVAAADPAWHERAGGTDPIPEHVPTRSFDLTTSEVRVGRHSGSRGIAPEVDLAGAPEDSAISHLHCLLLRQGDGRYELVDPGSTNGTCVDGAPDPIPPGVPVPVGDGSQIHIGAWTTLTLSALPLAPQGGG